MKFWKKVGVGFGAPDLFSEFLFGDMLLATDQPTHADERAWQDFTSISDLNGSKLQRRKFS